MPGAPLVSAPGDEGGPMTNGFTYQANLPAADLDVWSFNAVAGEGIVLRMGPTNNVYASTNLGSWIRLFDPSGAMIGQDYDTTYGGSSDVQARATKSGQFPVVVGPICDYYYGTGG